MVTNGLRQRSFRTGDFTTFAKKLLIQLCFQNNLLEGIKDAHSFNALKLTNASVIPTLTVEAKASF